MKIPVTLSMTKIQHEKLYHHLFPSDGMEAAAILLCSKRNGNRRHRLIVQEVAEIPYEACSYRSINRVTWSTEAIEHLLNKAATNDLSVIKVHSHPTGFSEFSKTDDKGDMLLLSAIHGWVGNITYHGSVIMLPEGQMFGRVLDAQRCFHSIECINVVGDDLKFWYTKNKPTKIPDFAASHAQIFDEGTIQQLQRMSIAVVGCSGTGSPIIEMLQRLCVGEIIIVDDDRIENRNINRIINSTIQDVEKNRFKVDVIAQAIEKTGIGTNVIALPQNLWNPSVIKEVAQCDVIFGCMDTIDGRYLLNTLATYYTIPYIDIGIRLDAIPSGPRKGQIREVCGTIHYLQPGGSSLLSRGLFNMKQVANAGLLRNDPKAHTQQISDGYIAGIVEHRPAVIHVNMNGASLAVNELLARLHPYREEHNSEYASVTFSLSSMEIIYDSENGSCNIISDCVGLGDTEPLLGMIEFSKRKVA